MVERAKRYIDEHYAHIKTIQDVASALNYSYHSLRKRFALKTGMPMNEYLHRTRVQAAKALLRKRSMKLYAVARTVGYSDDSALRRHWKKIFGKNPFHSG